MSEIISKELLSEVLGRTIERISINENRCEIRNSISFENYQLGVSYKYSHGNEEIRFMPIHELAYKCKEWAYAKYKYTIIEWAGGVDIMDGEDNEVETFLNLNHPLVLFNLEFTFKACQWILDNKDKQ